MHLLNAFGPNALGRTLRFADASVKVRAGKHEEHHGTTMAVTDPPATIAAAVERRRNDRGVALVFEGRRWTWADVVAEADRRAGMLLRRQQSGQPLHVGVLLDNVPEFVFVLFGAAVAGATVVGINPTRRGAELATDIRHTDCQLVITDAARALEVSGLVPEIDVLVDDSAGYRSLLAAPPAEAPVPVRAEDLYLLLFTSGSTGAPKAVRMSHGRAARQASESARAFTPEDVLYCAMPLFHGNALIANLFPGLVAGSQVILRRRFSASGFGPDIRAHGCTYFNYVGRALAYIVAVPESAEDGENRLKWGLGSEASPLTIAEFTRRFRCPVFEGYGSSENAVIISPAAGMPAGALGRPKRGTDVAIIDASGAECAAAELDNAGRLLNPGEAIGEIVGRNSVDRFEGYYRNPDAEAERTRNGWYWSGDLGYRDPDGWIYFAGRTADWLRVDGENFSAGAVERILNRFPGTNGVAVYGVPDPVTGDQVMVAIEVAAGDFDGTAFAGFVDDQPDLGTKWSPRFVRVSSDLPVTATRKVDKAALRAEGWEAAHPVYWRAARGEPYREMTGQDRDDLTGRFTAHGRVMTPPPKHREAELG